MSPMNQFINAWKAEEEIPIKGWEFPHLDGRMFEEAPPWSYIERAQELMQQGDSVLDLATGGGERLLRMRPFWPETVVATEGYPPNLKLARERLELFGVRVADLWSDQIRSLPFETAEFDLVIDRHAGFNFAEVARVLKPGGTFLTQQVHGFHTHDLLAVFDAPIPWPDATPEVYEPLLKAAGFTIVDAQDWTGKIEFKDVGAIVYYLRTVPWTVRDFSVDTHLKYLLQLQERLENEGKLIFETKKFLFEAKIDR